jgi:hypothetical protein
MKNLFFFIGALIVLGSCKNKQVQNATDKSLRKRDSLFAEAYKITSQNPVFGSEEFIKAYNNYSDGLEIDPKNLSGNYNMAILYYNQAVHKLSSIDSIAYISLFNNNSSYDMPFKAFFDTLKLGNVRRDAELKSWFSTAKKYFERSYQADTSKAYTLIGLEGCYRFLNDSVNYRRLEKKTKSYKDTLKGGTNVTD